MPPRGLNEVPYYSAHAVQRPVYATERLPSLPLPLPQQAYSGTSSPRVSSISSAASSIAGSQSSFTSAASSHGPKTPGTLSPTLASCSGISAPQGHAVSTYDPYPAMNQGAPDMYYQTHMPAVSAPPPQASMSSPYPHQQPTLLQPGPAQYAPAYGTQYAYANGLTSPSTGPPVTHSMQGQNVLPLPSVGAPPQGYNPHGFDTTGQVAPHGMKPRVTATLWEDEGSLCFQVEARGICVARRDGTSGLDPGNENAADTC